REGSHRFKSGRESPNNALLVVIKFSLRDRNIVANTVDLLEHFDHAFLGHSGLHIAARTNWPGAATTRIAAPRAVGISFILTQVHTDALCYSAAEYGVHHLEGLIVRAHTVNPDLAHGD